MNKEKIFNTLVSENGDRIRRICSYYNSNPEDQKDMYQEVLVNIWRSLDNFRGESLINTWIYRIAVNTSLTYKGKVNRNLKLMVSTHVEDINQILDEESRHEKIEQEENLEHLKVKINQLSILDKLLISLMLEGLSMREIADIIGITEPNVKVKIHRIKNELREQLKTNSNEIE